MYEITNNNYDMLTCISNKRMSTSNMFGGCKSEKANLLTAVLRSSMQSPAISNAASPSFSNAASPNISAAASPAFSNAASPALSQVVAKSSVTNLFVPDSAEIAMTRDQSTQTENRIVFRLKEPEFKDKVKAVLALRKYYHISSEYGIKALLFSVSKSYLSENNPENNAKYLFAATVRLLAEETISSSTELLTNLLEIVKESVLLTLALNIVICSGSKNVLLRADKQTEFLAAYCFALECLVKNENSPMHVLEEGALSNSELVMDILTCMCGSTYGSSFMDSSLDTPDIENVYQSCFKSE